MTTNTSKEASGEVQEFTIRIPDADLDDMYERLRRTRYAPDVGNDNWEYGFPTGYLREVVDYWLNEYDWRETERAMNEMAAHFKTTIDGQPIHFLHKRGTGAQPDAAAAPPRLALDVLGFAQGDRTPHQPGFARRRPERFV